MHASMPLLLTLCRAEQMRLQTGHTWTQVGLRACQRDIQKVSQSWRGRNTTKLTLHGLAAYEDLYATFV